MTVDAEIYSRLSGYAGLTALVSTRISHQKRQTNEALPGVLFAFVDRVPFHAMGSTGTGTLRRARLQVDCYADDITEALAVAAQIFAALSRYRTTSGTLISDVRMDAQRDLSELEDFEEGIFRVSQDYIVEYNE